LKNIRYIQPEEDDIINVGASITCQCFNVTDFNDSYYEGSIEYNSFGAIYKFIINGYVFLVSSDATPIVQNNMFKKLGKCDILQVEHHGINRTGCKEWCDVLKPHISVVSRYDSKYYDLYLSASPNVVEYMKTSTFYSNINEDIMIQIDNGITCFGNPVPSVKVDSDSLVNITTYARNSIEK
jgi:beta-lactamase superfamily II metal-dependent hydrolase